MNVDTYDILKSNNAWFFIEYNFSPTVKKEFSKLWVNVGTSLHHNNLHKRVFKENGSLLLLDNLLCVVIIGRSFYLSYTEDSKFITNSRWKMEYIKTPTDLYVSNMLLFFNSIKKINTTKDMIEMYLFKMN